MLKVLFVCYGNICRSPMGEAMLRDRAIKQKLNIEVDSAGTHVYTGGNPPYYLTQEVLDSLNITYDNMYSRSLTKQDFYSYDYIFGMDHDNVKDLKKRAPLDTRHKIHLFLEGVEPYASKSVPDPYYTRDFDETKMLIEKGLDHWIEIFKEALD